ncbi:MAG: malonyl-CoA decarboxylase [Rhodospirillales bacterium]|nr:malonyl-CoA decarboxylase [Rhodospirillales bacterium]
MSKNALLSQEAVSLFASRPRGRNWLERLWSSVAERGRSFAPIPASDINGLERARQLTKSLLSELGEASGAAVSKELLLALRTLPETERVRYFLFLAENFYPDEAALVQAAQKYLAKRGGEEMAALAQASEPPRQEVLRRINMAQGGTALLVAMRRELSGLMKAHPELKRLDADLRHLFASWFNRGFLELRRIDWHTSAAILEKLITYEAVHEIQGWDDLRRRLAPDRRCFGFFHPALPDEPLIFVEVALVSGLASSVQSLLERDTDEAKQIAHANAADSAIFYSISNCQDGLRGISFGNFLIKQVVVELHAELPGLKHFSTLSPVPGFRTWLTARLETKDLPEFHLTTEERMALLAAAGLPPGPEKDSHEVAVAIATLIGTDSWTKMAKMREVLRPALMRLAAIYLTQSAQLKFRIDPVARFHLGNGARLERINWMANANKAGLKESYCIMVNYLYDPEMIEANHEAFARDQYVARGESVQALLNLPPHPARPNLLRRYVNKKNLNE